jgi:hypothetical protein
VNRPGVRLAAFAAAVVGAVVIGVAVGSAVGPIDPPGSDRPPGTHQDHDD